MGVRERACLYSSGVEHPAPPYERKAFMLYTIAVVLLVLWLLGLVTSVTMGGLIHVLLVIAVIVILLQVIGGRRSI
jgi:hypothetical protein